MIKILRAGVEAVVSAIALVRAIMAVKQALDERKEKMAHE